MSAGEVIHVRRLAHVARRMHTAHVGRRLQRLAQRHLRDGLPQPAVFAFDHVGMAIALWGRYERDELELLMEALAPRLAPAGVCLDIGANIGNHALFFADHFAAVLAFEPNPRTYRLLALNAELRPNIRCWNFGLSDADGPARLAVTADNLGMATLHGGAGAVVDCELRRLDGLDLLDGQRVALIKIDVEGHEAAVLRGAATLLARDRPVVVFEQTAAEIEGGSSAAIELLRQHGYRHFWTFERTPAARWRWLGLLRRLAFGEVVRLVECSVFEKRFHSMIVALPATAT
ncbi:FkbM family methyltransferase [uncultured Piscinibacter sp.]|uniref:FkbM family methyltransferase n=1 Tax=uncultured Piscinibacter sp. TaxID=1131835 RepID=UPI00261B2924|nr:FkbM family methyltransferase [uncultured Piscinibacter sp.]